MVQQAVEVASAALSPAWVAAVSVWVVAVSCKAPVALNRAAFVRA